MWLQDAMLSPRAVRDSDLVQRFWPPHATEEVQQQRPHIALQLSLAPSGSFRNFRLGPGGASTWVHVISGKKVTHWVPLDHAESALLKVIPCEQEGLQACCPALCTLLLCHKLIYAVACDASLQLVSRLILPPPQKHVQ